MRRAAIRAPGSRAGGKTAEAQLPRCGEIALRSSLLEGEGLPRHGDEEFLERLLAVLLRQGPRVSFEQDFPARQEEHPVADVRDLVHVVRGPKHPHIVLCGVCLLYTSDA